MEKLHPEDTLPLLKGEWLLIILQWMEVKPDEIDDTLRMLSIFPGNSSIHRKFITVISYHLIFNATIMP